MKKAESISFLTDDNEKVELFILDQTSLNGKNYLLVSEDPEPADTEDTLVYIMRETGGSEDDMVSYVFVDEDEELEVVSSVFEQLLEDMDIEVE